MNFWFSSYVLGEPVVNIVTEKGLFVCLFYFASEIAKCTSLQI